MKKTKEIQQNVQASKSLIEYARQRKRKEEDDREIKKQIEMIKDKNLHKRREKYSDQNRVGTASTYKQGLNLLNRMS